MAAEGREGGMQPRGSIAAPVAIVPKARLRHEGVGDRGKKKLPLQPRGLRADVEGLDKGGFAIGVGIADARAADGVRFDERRRQFFLLAIENLEGGEMQLFTDDGLDEDVATAAVARGPHFAHARALGG